MKQGMKSLDALYGELKRQRACRKDYVADTRSLSIKTDGGESTLTINGVENVGLKYRMSPLACRQMAERIHLPMNYFERCMTVAPQLLDENVNYWLSHVPEKRMIRVLDGRVRAVLSDRYRRLDNLELLDVVLPEIKNKMPDAYIESMNVTETHLYIKVINQNTSAEIVPGDIVKSGFVLSNSEVGRGSIIVAPLVYRLVCKNGMVINELRNRQYHLGRSTENDDMAYELYSDKTKALDDATYYSKAVDVIKAVADQTKFETIVERMRMAKSIGTGDNPGVTVLQLSDQFILSASERDLILKHFIHEDDYSLYGLSNAMTRASQDIDNYDRASDLEMFGGTLLMNGFHSTRTRPKIKVLAEGSK